MARFVGGLIQKWIGEQKFLDGIRAELRCSWVHVSVTGSSTYKIRFDDTRPLSTKVGFFPFIDQVAEVALLILTRPMPMLSEPVFGLG
jgi:hypothetical protein